MSGASFRFVEIANDVNNEMPTYMVSGVRSALNRQRKTVNDARVLVVGRSDKKNSKNGREPPATGVISGLIELAAEDYVRDAGLHPHVIAQRTRRIDTGVEEVGAADVPVVVTDHGDTDRYRITARTSYVLNTRKRLQGGKVEPL